MCLVIDMNTVPCVFNRESDHHQDYAPVLDWIINGKGKMVCGGSKYWEEFKKISKYLRFLNQLNKAGKVVKVDDQLVDAKMNELKSLCSHRDFDDPHIAALLIISGCKVLCSEDERSYPFIKRKEWYPQGKRPPKIYKRTAFSRASIILSDENIADICTPCLKLKKEQTKVLLE